MYKSISRFIQFRREHDLGAEVVHSQKKPVSAHLIRAHERQEPVGGRIDGQIRGGFEVSLNGHRAFCPHSEMYPSAVERSAGIPIPSQQVDFLVIGVGRDSVVVSRKRAARAVAYREVVSAMHDGRRLLGTVASIRDFGAFVDVGGTSGWLHSSKFPPAFGVEVGQRLEVAVEAVARREGRTLLSLSAPRVVQKRHFERRPKKRGRN